MRSWSTTLLAFSFVGVVSAQRPAQVPVASGVGARTVGLVGGRDWPQWRGPLLDGSTDETGWTVDGAAESVWKKNVGLGYSSASIVEGRLYTLGHDREKEADTVFCLDAMTGAEIWTYSFPSITMAKFHSGGSLTTPSVHGGRVFVSNREGKLFCLDAATGKVRWKKDLAEQHEITMPTWGLAASPLLVGGRVYMNVGYVLAFSEAGKLLWKTGESYGQAYATPTPVVVDKRSCLAVVSSRGLTILDRADGTLVVPTYEWKTPYDVNAAAPVVCGNKIFISSGYNHGCAMLEIKAGKLEPVWQSKVMRTHMSGCVLVGEHLYGFDEATLKCIDLDGKLAWRKRGFGKGALIVAGDRLLILSKRGELVIAAAKPQEFQELSRANVLHRGVYWTTPTLSHGMIYCRNSLGDLVCLDHRGQPRQSAAKKSGKE